MKDLYIYQPGTETFISLARPTYLVDSSQVADEVMETMRNGWQASPREHLGYRLDNFNMTNLFFGEDN